MAKVVLMTLERMTLYLEKHPNVIKDIATNCAVVDEELNEFPNAKVRSKLPVLQCDARQL